jgi:hypothetical protein
VKAGKTAMQTVVAAQERKTPTAMDSVFQDHPHQDAVPVELRHFLHDALARNKDDRFASAEEMLMVLEGVRSGDFAVACPITFMKANNTKMGRFMDRHPIASMWVFTGAFLGFLGGVAGWVMWAMAA